MKKVVTYIMILKCLMSFSQAKEECWPVFRGDQQFRGIAPCEIPDNFTLKWIYKSKEKIKSSPLICRKNVFIATSSGSLINLDAEGNEKWKIKENVSFEAPSLLLNDVIYIGSLEGNFYAINAENGIKIWTYKTTNQIIGSANWFQTGKKTSLVFGCYDFKIYCLDAQSGKLNWTYETGNYINGGPTVAGNKILFGGCDSYMHVISSENGTLIKKIELGTYIAGSASIVNNTAFLGNYDGEFMSVDLTKGVLNWKISLNDQASVIASPSIVNNKIIIGARDQRIHCLDTKTGNKLWSFKTQGNIDASTIADEKRVLACSFDGRVYILDISSGKEIFSFDLGIAISGTPAIVKGLIVVAADNGNIYGFKF